MKLPHSVKIIVRKVTKTTIRSEEDWNVFRTLYICFEENQLKQVVKLFVASMLTASVVSLGIKMYADIDTVLLLVAE